MSVPLAPGFAVGHWTDEEGGTGCTVVLAPDDAVAAERTNPAALAQLDESIAQMDDLTDFDAYRRADVRFHIALAEAAGTPRLIAEMTEVQGEMTELIALIAHPDVVLGHSNDEHRRIVACLREGDGLGAVRILRAHLAGTEHIIAGLIPANAAA